MAFSNATETKQKLKQSPQQYLVSTMVESTTDELIQLINRETEKNVALEAEDPREVSIDGTSSSSDNEDDEANSDPGSVLDTPENDMPAPASEADPTRLTEYEDDSPSDRIGTSSPDDDEYSPGLSTVSEDSFRDDLKSQIDMLDITKDETYLAYYIIDSLDDDGYLRRPLNELVDELEFEQHYTTTEEDVEAVLVEIVQEELEPAGIGARDLRECMLLQLQEKKGKAASLAYRIVNECFADLASKRYDRIEQNLEITDHHMLVDALHVIRHLSPKPGNMKPAAPKSSNTLKMQVRPDFTVRNEDGQLVVWLNDGQIPQVRISKEKELEMDKLQQQADQKLQAGNKVGAAEKRQGVSFLRDSIQKGKLFIDALSQRRVTLMSVMETIVRLQRAFFMTGQVETIKPMTLETVANQCNYDISTISRVSNSKFVDTEFGILAIRDLFTNAVGESNQIAVVSALKQIIDNEDKTNPLTDEALATELAKQGHNISRRTVVKYREMLNCPVARLRKEL